MLQGSELSKLRAKLRQVNMEYSALVRDRRWQGRLVRMDELSNERSALLVLISARRDPGCGSMQRLLPMPRSDGDQPNL